MDASGTLTLEGLDPAWFWAVVVVVSVGVLALTYRGIYQRSGRKLTWTLAGLRGLGVLALLVALVKPVWQETTVDEQRPQVAVIVDDSQSMSLPVPGRAADAAAGDAMLSRYEAARQWLEQSDAGQRLRDRFEVHLLDLRGEALASRAMASEPAGEQTDLVRALHAAASRARGQHVAGVLLISDGRDTTGRDGYLALESYPLPIYTLGFAPRGSATDAVDVSIASVDAPQRTLVHNTVPVTLLVRKTGGEAMTFPLHIERAGQVLATEPITLDEGAVEQRVTVQYTPEQAGDFAMTVRLEPGAADRTPSNDTGVFKLRVEAEPIRVLYIEGVLRSESRFLRERLHDDPDVDLITFTRSVNPDQSSLAEVLAGAELITPERLEQIDVVLLGDFEASMLDEPTYQHLRDWVEAGGGLMLLAGYRNLGPTGLGGTPIADVLPVHLGSAAGRQLDELFRFELSDAGRRHPALSLTGDWQRDAELWRALPELGGVALVEGVRAGAQVLARHPLPDPADREGRGHPVLITQRFGQGVSGALLADTTWRWSRVARLSGEPDTMYVRFWSQMIRWLAQREDEQPRTVLTVATDAAAYRRGERVAVTVQRNLAAMLPGSSDAPSELKLSIEQPGGSTTPLRAEPDATDANLWHASYFPDRGGRFTVHAALAGAGTDAPSDLATQQSEFVVAGSDLELQDPAVNPAALQQIARLTGGLHAALNEPDAAARLLDALPTAPRSIERVQRTQLWNSPVLFVAFLALVTGEWLLRRRNQMV